MMKSIPFRLLVALVFTVPTLAHDYWLQPKPFFSKPGENVTIHLYVGDSLEAETERKFERERIVSLRVFSKEGVKDLMDAGRADASAFLRLAFPSAGGRLIAYERDARTVEIEPREFTAYLEMEGLDAAREARAKSGRDGEKGRERYRRYLKSLVQVGDERDDAYQTVVGQKLEIIPLKNPATLKSGDELPVRVAFEGRPLADAKFFALHRTPDGKVETQAVRTTADGTATVRVSGSGLWVLRLVHMRPCTEDCASIDWESFWGSYSFGVR
jgi:uncharacterized GH25 family protein